MKSISSKRILIHVVGIGALILAGCGGGNDPDQPPPGPAMSTIEVTVTNLTNAQPLSPIAVIAHTDTYAVFEIGIAATEGLEQLAEGGDNAMLLSEADGDSAVIATASGSGVIAPAGSETVSIEVLESDLAGLTVSVTSMLVNTNDAITGVNGILVGDMQPGDILQRRTIAYDAGTEADNELGADIPGPAGGGEGFNAARDDSADRVTMHAGVVTSDDGLATSGLGGQHRFDNPVAAVRIERID